MRKERKSNMMNATDRVRIEARANDMGAHIEVAEATRLVVVSANGVIATEYTFDEDGKLIGYTHPKF